MDHRIPVVSSIADAAKNMYGPFSLGFNAGKMPNTNQLGFHGTPLRGQLSVGGMLTAGGLPVAGAAIGAAIGSQMQGDMVGTMALGGAAIGAAALPAAGLVAKASIPIGAAAFDTTVGLAKAAPGAALAAGKGAMSVLSSSNIVGKIPHAAVGFASMMVDWDNVKKANGIINSVKFTGPTTNIVKQAKAGYASGGSAISKLAKGTAGGIKGAASLETLVNGKSMLWGAALVGGAAGAFNEANKIHMGQMDGMVRKPGIAPSYANNAGASGDLVFALNNNRRG